VDKLVFTSLSGQNSVAHRMQQISNEIANVSTTGFKRSFAAALQTYRYEGDGFETRFVPVLTPATAIDMKPGPITSTGRPLDVAIGGTQLLAVRASDGSVAYTRRGDLNIDAGGTLRVGSGEAILDDGGNPVQIPALVEVKVGTDGTIFTKTPGEQAAIFLPLGRMQIAEPLVDAIRLRTDGLYSNATGEPFPLAETPSLQSGALEGSNTNLFSTMVDMISMSRRYEMQVKVLKQASDLAERSQSMARLSQ
jgi:flagellar basal-body rod protein FlgF